MSVAAKYLETLIDTPPSSVYVLLICVAVVYSSFIIGIKGLKEGFRLSIIGILFIYAVVVVCITFVFRSGSFVYEIRLIPFGSYLNLYDGCKRAFEENLMNLLAFVPIGFLMTVSAKEQNWKRVAIVGLCFSFVIEFLQFHYKRGIGEIDDLIHNTIGCVIGYFVAKAIMRFYIIKCFSK